MLSGILNRALAETFLDIGNNTSDRGYVFSNPTTRLLDRERDDMNMDSVALLGTVSALIQGSVLGWAPTTNSGILGIYKDPNIISTTSCGQY